MANFDLGLLGVKMNVPKVNFTDYSGVIEAPEKWGKTALAALYPNAIILAFEKGYKTQSVNVRDINKWEDLLDFVKLLKKHREEIGDSIQTIVFDTVDLSYPMAEPYMCKKEGFKDGKIYLDKTIIPYGQGWALHDKYFRDVIKEIYSLGFTILYLTHSEIKTIKPKDEEPYEIYKSTMSDRLANIVYAEVDYIIHGERVMVDIGNGQREAKRALVVKGNGNSVAGSRVYFDENITFDSEEEAMEKFQEKFIKKIKSNLEKAGIKEDLETLSKKQKAESDAKVKEFVKESEIVDLVEEAKTLYKECTDNEKKTNAAKVITGKGKANMSELDVADIEEIIRILS